MPQAESAGGGDVGSAGSAADGDVVASIDLVIDSVGGASDKDGAISRLDVDIGGGDDVAALGELATRGKGRGGAAGGVATEGEGISCGDGNSGISKDGVGGVDRAEGAGEGDVVGVGIRANRAILREDAASGNDDIGISGVNIAIEGDINAAGNADVAAACVNNSGGDIGIPVDSDCGAGVQGASAGDSAVAINVDETSVGRDRLGGRDVAARIDGDITVGADGSGAGDLADIRSEGDIDAGYVADSGGLDNAVDTRGDDVCRGVDGAAKGEDAAGCQGRVATECSNVGEGDVFVACDGY